MALDAAFRLLSREQHWQERRLAKEKRPHVQQFIKNDIADIKDATQVLIAERHRRNEEAKKGTK